jgi:hypothetical protein
VPFGAVWTEGWPQESGAVRATSTCKKSKALRAGISIASKSHRDSVIDCQRFAILPVMTKDQLVALWEEHIADEFTIRDTEATLGTMVPDAYVNHIPVIGPRGRCGRPEVRGRSAHDLSGAMASGVLAADLAGLDQRKRDSVPCYSFGRISSRGRDGPQRVGGNSRALPERM